MSPKPHATVGAGVSREQAYGNVGKDGCSHGTRIRTWSCRSMIVAWLDVSFVAGERRAGYDLAVVAAPPAPELLDRRASHFSF